MQKTDAVELARGIKTVGYSEWTDVTDGVIYVTCGECGNAHAMMLKETGPGMQRVRLVPEDELTQATRENDNLSLPLYRELIRLREENMQLKREKQDGS